MIYLKIFQWGEKNPKKCGIDLRVKDRITRSAVWDCCLRAGRSSLATAWERGGTACYCDPRLPIQAGEGFLQCSLPTDEQHSQSKSKLNNSIKGLKLLWNLEENELQQHEQMQNFCEYHQCRLSPLA